MAATSVLWGVAALGLETTGSICFNLARTMVFGYFFSWFRLGRSSSAGFWLGFLSGARWSWSRGTDRRLIDWTCPDY